MVLNLIIFLILFSTILILWSRTKISQTSKTKFDANGNQDVNSEITDEDDVKYVSKRLGFLFKLGFLSLLSSRRNVNNKDTMYDKLYNEMGSPNSENPKSTFIAKCLHITFVYPKAYNVIKTFLCNDNCTDRFPESITAYYCRGRGKGILFNNGEEAKELRRYTMKTLGHLGFGKNHRMSEILYEQLSDLLENLETRIASTNNKIQVHNLFTNSVVSIVWRIIGGEKFAPNDPNLLLLYKNVEVLANLNLTTVILLMYFPKRILSYFDIFGLGVKDLFEALDTLNNYFLNYIEEKKLRPVGTDPLDYLDHFLLEIEKHRSDDQFSKIYCEDQLAYVLLDLFGAGMDTTSKYMESAFMFMALHPEVQVKIQEEIDSVIGVGVPSHTIHRKRMPFTEATIMEIHRLGNVVPAMPRRTNKDVDIDGRHFEKGEMVLANFFFFRMDEPYWGDPKVFRPERFLDNENNLIVDKVNHVMPFGAGPRACVGESVATSSIFTFFTGILQRFSIEQSDRNELLGLSKGFVAVSYPEPFHVSLIHRNN